MVDRVAIIRQGAIVKIGTLAEMQELSALNVQAVLADATNAAKFSQEAHFTQSGNKISFTVSHEALPTVLASLGQMMVHDLQITPPTLEDIFLQFYVEDKEVATDDQE
ncbi:ABC transporter ATP-binding protein [Weissella oryzae SG25]|uniref:ABC transporter ATP-binding protein n=1 Tax=Weissella oryzae (strain DSM 25784 / JCM 18191 / LMG 30913 / SG25) TaxID=1329250 RepID=A0A069CZI0_WEIOS|nr:ABC transporter ATP-binding protein [Weissella oryzae SG25]